MKERDSSNLWGVDLDFKDGLQVTATGLMSGLLVTRRLLVRSPAPPSLVSRCP